MTSIVRIAVTQRNLTAGWERFFATSASKPKRGGLARPGGRTAILPQCSRDASRRPADRLSIRGNKGSYVRRRQDRAPYRQARPHRRQRRGGGGARARAFEHIGLDRAA